MAPTTIVAPALGACLFASASLAQPCAGPAFLPGEPGDSGIADPFSAYVGPMTEFNSRLVVGGAFSQAGPLAVNIVAAFDPSSSSWSRLGDNIDLGSTNGYAAAVASFPIGGTQNLILGGSFAAARNGGIPVPNSASLARWDGSAWRNMNTGWGPSNRGSVWAIFPWQTPQGPTRLVVGGGWSAIGTASADGIALFDPATSTWSNIAGTNDLGIAGDLSPTVFAVTTFNNQLFIGGRFSTVNGNSAPLVARWTGSVWQRAGTLAARSVTSDVSAFALFNDGSGARLFAGGYEMSVGGLATSIAAWNGAVWQRVGQNLGGRCTSLAVFDPGDGPHLYAGLTADANQNYIYRLENNQWVPVGGGVAFPITGNFPSVFGLRVHEGSLFVGGNFQQAGPLPAYGIARFGPCPTPTGCRPDFNADSLLDPDDLSDYITCYFSLPPCAAGDYNLSGTTDPDDLSDIIADYFAGCP